MGENLENRTSAKIIKYLLSMIFSKLRTPNFELLTDDKVYRRISNKVVKEFRVGENFSSW